MVSESKEARWVTIALVYGEMTNESKFNKKMSGEIALVSLSKEARWVKQ